MATPEEEEEERRRRNSGSSLNPLNWLRSGFDALSSGFGALGTLFSFIIPMLIIAPLIYFVAQNEGVQEWVGSWLDDEGKPGSGKAKVKGFVEDANLMIAGALDKIGISGPLDSALAKTDIAKTLTDKGLSAEAVKILAPDQATGVATVNFIRKEGDIANPTGDKTIYAFLEKKPELVGQLLATAKTSGTLTADQKKQAEEVLGSLRTIVADGRIDTLLSAENPKRATYLSIIQKQVPSLPIEKVTQLVNLGFGPDKKLTADFRTALTGMLTTDEAARSTALATLLTSPTLKNNEKLVLAAVTAVDTKQITDPKAKAEAEAAKAIAPKIGLDGMAAYERLKAAGVDLTKEFSGVTVATNNLVNLLLDKDDLRTKLATPASRKDLGFLMSKLLPANTATEKQAYGFLTTRAPDHSYANVNALLNLVDAVDKKGNDTLNKKVLNQFITAVTTPDGPQKQQAIGRINPTEFAGFMKVHQVEFGVFLREMNNGKLSAPQQNLVKGLRATWGDADAGIAEVLSDTNGAKFVLNAIANPSSMLKDIGDYIPSFGSEKFKNAALDTAMAAYLKAQGGKVAENSPQIVALSHALLPAKSAAGR